MDYAIVATIVAAILGLFKFGDRMLGSKRNGNGRELDKRIALLHKDVEYIKDWIGSELGTARSPGNVWKKLENMSHAIRGNGNPHQGIVGMIIKLEVRLDTIEAQLKQIQKWTNK
jgi:hypothetical protein